MSCERIFGACSGTSDRLELLTPVFERLWPVDEAAGFGKLLRRIDEALIQHRSHNRIARLNRMLERNYAA